MLLGDKFSPGDTLFEVQTDKAVIPFELEEEGIIAKILVPENSDTIKVGQLVAIYVSPGDDWKNVQFDAPSKSAPATPVTKKEESAAPAAQAEVQHKDLSNRLDSRSLISSTQLTSALRVLTTKLDVFQENGPGGANLDPRVQHRSRQADRNRTARFHSQRVL